MSTESMIPTFEEEEIDPMAELEKPPPADLLGSASTSLVDVPASKPRNRKRPCRCSCSFRISRLAKVVAYLDIVICLAGIAVAIYFLDYKAELEKNKEIDAYLLLTTSCGIQMTYSLLGLLASTVLLIPCLKATEWASKAMRIVAWISYAGIRESLMLVQLVLLLFKYSDPGKTTPIICSVFAFLMILYGFFFSLFLEYRMQVKGGQVDEDLQAKIDEMDPSRNLSMTALSTSSRFHSSSHRLIANNIKKS